MKVLSVSYPFAPVTEAIAGGAEQVLRMIDGALVARGWQSMVIAPGESRVRGRLFPVPVFAGAIGGELRRQTWQAWRTAIEQVIDECHPDVVHFHGVDFPAYLPERDTPMLATLHLPREHHATDVFALGRDRLWLNAVSRAQLHTFPPSHAVLGWVENGVELERFLFHREKQPFLLAMGRICPEKGFHLALDAARRAGARMVVAGQVFGYPSHQAYFVDEIVPRLDAERIFIGPVGGERKRRLLAAARCLLVPSLASETSSLVAMEALASGTPVVAFAAGALPEIVHHGRTGFIVDSEAAMQDAIARVDRIDGRDCRHAAEARFSATRMARDYISLYQQIARPRRRARARAASVETVRDIASLESLAREWEALWQTCAGATPFQHPGWLLPWWRAFGNGKSLFTVTVRRNGRLTALAPCCIQTCNGAAAPELVLVGTGNTDHQDALYKDPADAELIVDHICAQQDSWGRVDLQDLSPRSQLFAAALPAGFVESRGSDATCPVTTFPAAAKCAADLISAHFARSLRRAEGHLRKRGALTVERPHTEAQAHDILETLFALHKARWTARGSRSAVDGQPVRAFHHAVIAALFDAGLVRLYRLIVSGRPLAAYYGFSYTDTAYFYLAGFDPAARALSPGHMIVAHAIDEALGEGARRFDFLRGREPYKYRWQAQDEHNVRRRIWKRG